MDYEKKYKEALERAKSALNDETISNNTIAYLQDIFPELKESEDARIRGEIIATIHLYYGEPIEEEAKRMIDWLEKQKEPVEINPTEFDTRLQALIGKFDSLPKEELIGSLSFWLNVVQNDGTYKDKEKQGKQKSIIEMKSPEESLGISSKEYSEIDRMPNNGTVSITINKDL